MARTTKKPGGEHGRGETKKKKWQQLAARLGSADNATQIERVRHPSRRCCRRESIDTRAIIIPACYARYAIIDVEDARKGSDLIRLRANRSAQGKVFNYRTVMPSAIRALVDVPTLHGRLSFSTENSIRRSLLAIILTLFNCAQVFGASLAKRRRIINRNQGKQNKRIPSSLLFATIAL